MNIKKNIPNAITCGNLLCGCLAIVKCFEGDLVWAAYLVGIAAVLDFFDGFAARLLKVSSPIGKDLDSLADMVTFGVVPGIILFQLIIFSNYDYILANLVTDGQAKSGWTIYPPLSSLNDDLPDKLNESTFNNFIMNQNMIGTIYYLKYLAFLVPIFSAIRLAKFNNDTRQTDSFIGLPTPANAILICSLPLILEFNKSITLISNTYVLCLVSCIMSLLLVANLPLIALKFKNFTWADNKIRFIFLGLSVVLLVAFQFVGIPLVIILYILVSIVNNIFFKKKV